MVAKTEFRLGSVGSRSELSALVNAKRHTPFATIYKRVRLFAVRAPGRWHGNLHAAPLCQARWRSRPRSSKGGDGTTPRRCSISDSHAPDCFRPQAACERAYLTAKIVGFQINQPTPFESDSTESRSRSPTRAPHPGVLSKSSPKQEQNADDGRPTFQICV